MRRKCTLCGANMQASSMATTCRNCSTRLAQVPRSLFTTYTAQKKKIIEMRYQIKKMQKKLSLACERHDKTRAKMSKKLCPFDLKTSFLIKGEYYTMASLSLTDTDSYGWEAKLVSCTAKKVITISNINWRDICQ